MCGKSAQLCIVIYIMGKPYWEQGKAVRMVIRSVMHTGMPLRQMIVTAIESAHSIAIQNPAYCCLACAKVPL